jgi:hypothetical protein
MMNSSTTPPSPLQISPRITFLPVVNGSGPAALAVRKWLLEHPCDCLAVGLPESFRYGVLDAITLLPHPSIVLQRAMPSYESNWSPNNESDDDPKEDCSYVPIDPCQPVIMALRIALGEKWNIEFCDLETNDYQPMTSSLPDAYALKTVSVERFATAVLPHIIRPPHEQVTQRLQHMARRLKQLERKYKHIVLVSSILEWPWLKEAYDEPSEVAPQHDSVEVPTTYSVSPNSLLFMLGELPYVTGLYEHARAQLDSDDNIAIDAIKHLLLSARASYRQDFGKRARKITPLMLMQCLKYIRNLCLLNSSMTPELYTIGVAAQQILGDQYTIHLIETARHYPFCSEQPMLEEVTMGIDQLRLPDGDMVNVFSRLPGVPIFWQTLKLRRKPLKKEIDEWKMQWNPFSQCSWPPEDNVIESFRTRVADRAQAIAGADLARSEKFTTSIKDGIDIRETLRHWYDKEIFVKVLPPSIGKLDCVLMLFDCPADPSEYNWRSTWFAEHQNESTLAFFATDFSKEVIGPGIAIATYGGAMFLFPPVKIPDIWHDPNLRFAESLEDRLIAAACFHSRQRRVALLSPKAPGARWRQIARRFSKQLVHVPLSQFNDAMIQQMRMVHVLNGQQVRSYAEHFIRKA